jgi:hypothetical protein
MRDKKSGLGNGWRLGKFFVCCANFGNLCIGEVPMFLSDDLNKLTKLQLMALAMLAGIELNSSLTKLAMINALASAGYHTVSDLEQASPNLVRSNTYEHHPGLGVDPQHIKKNLSIRLPESTNPIHFSNFVPMDFDFAEILRRNLSYREIKTGLPPEARAMEEEVRDAKPDVPVGPSTREKFKTEWQVIDAEGASTPSRWQFGPEYGVIQTRRSGVAIDGQYYGLGTVAIHTSRLEDNVQSLRLTMKMGKKNEAGLVFNYLNPADYWVIRYRHWAGSPDPYKYTIAILHIQDQKINWYDEESVSPLDEKEIVFTIVNDLKNKKLTFTASSTDVVIVRSNETLLPNSGVGLFTRFCDSARFTRLEVIYDSPQVLIPRPPDLDEDLEYQKSFQMDTFDLRPMLWLRTIQKLWAEKVFADNRFHYARERYDKTFTSETSPEAIDNAEGLYRAAFEKKLQADRVFDEFKAYLGTQGVSFDPAEEQSADLLGDYNFNLQKQYDNMTIESWKEFYIVYHLTNPERIFTNRVRHDTYLRTELGPYHVYANVDAKFWETRYRPVTRRHVMTVSQTGNLFEDLQKLIQNRPFADGDTEDQSEKDIRRYRFIDGEFIDQYGKSLQDQVIEITEEPLPGRESVMVVPVVDDPDAPDDYSRLVVIHNPVFSGKKLHPPMFMFEEKFVLDVSWSGIGLGEFSHSVNLFPGEERELQVVTSKKRAFETVSTVTEAKRGGHVSETATATKRNDSFDSKLSDAFTLSQSRSAARASSSAFDMSAEVGGGLFVTFDVSSKYSSRSSSSSASSLSSTEKRAKDLASHTSGEVSRNNKVSFSSSTDMEKSLEEKVSGEDMETETMTISVSNVNQGRTINYNFFQVTNIYATTLRLEDVKLHISTGIEIIPGTGLTLGKIYNIEDFGNILQDFRIFSVEDRREMLKAVAAQILKRYLYLEGDEILEDPQIAHAHVGDVEKFRNLRQTCQAILFDETQFKPQIQEEPPTPDDVPASEEIPDTEDAPAPQATPAQENVPAEATFRQPFPDDLLELSHLKMRVQGMQVGESSYYTINSGNYYVDAQVGLMPATEQYLEDRRTIETAKQKAQVQDLKAKTEAGVFFQELPDGVTSLDIQAAKADGKKDIPT